MDAGDWERARALLFRHVVAVVWAALVVWELVTIASVQPDLVVPASAPGVTAVVVAVPTTAPASTTSTSSPAAVATAVSACGLRDGACADVVVASTDR